MKILLVFTELNQKFGALRSQHGLAFLSAVLKKNGYPEVRLSYFAGILDFINGRKILGEYDPI